MRLRRSSLEVAAQEGEGELHQLRGRLRLEGAGLAREGHGLLVLVEVDGAGGAACTVYFDQYQQTVTFTREAGALEPEPPPELVELTLAFLRSHLK